MCEIFGIFGKSCKHSHYFHLGDSSNSLSIVFNIAPCTIANIINEVCEAIYFELKDEFLKVIILHYEFLYE